MARGSSCFTKPWQTQNTIKWFRRRQTSGANVRCQEGNQSWTYIAGREDGSGEFAVVVGHVENGGSYPFECWVNDHDEAIRGLGAIAKTLSMDMRCHDRAWLLMKLDALSRTVSVTDNYYKLEIGTEIISASTAASALGQIVRYRIKQLGALEKTETATNPVIDALFAKKEPKSGPNGTMSWSVDINNPQTGDDFVLFIKELTLPNGQRRPFSVWMAGNYPSELDGLCKLISLDMRVIDPAWIGMKLRKLLSYAEPQGDFFARVPGSEKSQSWPSTIAYAARLITHRYAMLGILSEKGYPIESMGVMVEQGDLFEGVTMMPVRAVLAKPCPECGLKSLVKRDGCEFCTACGAVGACG